MNRRNENPSFETMQPLSTIASFDIVIYSEAVDEVDYEDVYVDSLEDEDYENMVDPREYRW